MKRLLSTISILLLPVAAWAQSRLPQIRSGQETERTLCWNYESYAAVRQGAWKAVLRRGRGDKPDGPWELYDLASDRSETENVAESHPEVVTTLAGIWEAWSQDVGSEQ